MEGVAFSEKHCRIFGKPATRIRICILLSSFVCMEAEKGNGRNIFSIDNFVTSLFTRLTHIGNSYRLNAIKHSLDSELKQKGIQCIIIIMPEFSVYCSYQKLVTSCFHTITTWADSQVVLVRSSAFVAQTMQLKQAKQISKKPSLYQLYYTFTSFLFLNHLTLLIVYDNHIDSA